MWLEQPGMCRVRAPGHDGDIKSVDAASDFGDGLEDTPGAVRVGMESYSSAGDQVQQLGSSTEHRANRASRCGRW